MAEAVAEAVMEAAEAVAVVVAVADGTEVGFWGTLYGTDGSSLRVGMASLFTG